MIGWSTNHAFWHNADDVTILKANHAPGEVLQPSVAVVSSTVAGAIRTVTVTRALKLADYEASYYDFDVTLASLPYIAAIGSGPSFAYHKSHALGTLALFAGGGAPTCICAASAPAFGNTAGGTVRFSCLCMQPIPLSNQADHSTDTAPPLIQHSRRECILFFSLTGTRSLYARTTL
jgi:hypothetical protein